MNYCYSIWFEKYVFYYYYLFFSSNDCLSFTMILEVYIQNGYAFHSRVLYLCHSIYSWWPGPWGITWAIQKKNYSYNIIYFSLCKNKNTSYWATAGNKITKLWLPFYNPLDPVIFKKDFFYLTFINWPVEPIKYEIPLKLFYLYSKTGSYFKYYCNH